MELESVTLKLPRDLLSGAQRVATARDVTVGHLVRHLLKREVERQLAAKGRVATDDRLLTALQALLGRDMEQASGWDDLAERLRPHGYTLHPSSSDMTLIKTSCGTRVCAGAEIGFSYAALVKRFGGHMPGHSQATAGQSVMPAGSIDATRHAMLSAHMESARSWPDLINRLAVEGMELRPLGAGLGIYSAATGRHLCNTSTVGTPYRALVARFGADIPAPKPIKASEEGVTGLIKRSG